MVGRGFYVAKGDLDQRRIGYGIHNIVVFPLEQAGVPGFLLGLAVFCIFLLRPWRQFRNAKDDRFRQLAGLIIFCWAVGIFVSGQSGQIFWLFEAFGNWFIIVLSVWSLLVFPLRSKAQLSGTIIYRRSR